MFELGNFQVLPFDYDENVCRHYLYFIFFLFNQKCLTKNFLLKQFFLFNHKNVRKLQTVSISFGRSQLPADRLWKCQQYRIQELPPPSPLRLVSSQSRPYLVLYHHSRDSVISVSDIGVAPLPSQSRPYLALHFKQKTTGLPLKPLRPPRVNQGSIGYRSCAEPSIIIINSKISTLHVSIFE